MMEENFNNGFQNTTTENQTNTTQTEQNAQQFTQPDNSGYQQFNSNEFASYAPATAVKKSKTPIIIAIVAVVAAALIVGGYFLISSLMGGSGYEQSERKFFGDMMSSVDSAMDTTAEVSANGTAKSTLKLEIADSLVSMLTGAEGMTINPTEFVVYTNIQDKDVTTVAKWLNGTKEVLTANMWFDLDFENMYFNIPDYFGKCFKIVTDTAVAATAAPAAVSEADIKLIEEIGNKVADEYFKAVGDAKMSKGKSEINGTTVEYDIATIEIDEKLINKLAYALLNAIDSTDGAYEFIATYSGQDAATFEMMVQMALSSYESEGVAETGSDKVMLTMDVYLKDGTSVGRKLSADKVAFEYVCVTNGDSTLFNASFNDGNGTSITATADCTTTGGKSTGTVSASFVSDGNTVDFSVDFKDLVAELDNYGGTFSLSIPTIATTVDGTLSMNGKERVTAIDVYVGGSKMATLTLGAEEDVTYDFPAKPDTSDAIELVYDGEEIPDELMAELEGFDIEGFIGNLADENGNYDLLGMVFSMLGMSMSSPDSFVMY